MRLRLTFSLNSHATTDEIQERPPTATNENAAENVSLQSITNLSFGESETCNACSQMIPRSRCLKQMKITDCEGLMKKEKSNHEDGEDSIIYFILCVLLLKY